MLREEKRLEDTDGTEARKKKNGNRRLDEEATLLASGRALQAHPERTLAHFEGFSKPIFGLKGPCLGGAKEPQRRFKKARPKIAALLYS